MNNKTNIIVILSLNELRYDAEWSEIVIPKISLSFPLSERGISSILIISQHKIKIPVSFGSPRANSGSLVKICYKKVNTSCSSVINLRSFQIENGVRRERRRLVGVPGLPVYGQLYSPS
jgi:hypothetical protein